MCDADVAADGQSEDGGATTLLVAKTALILTFSWVRPPSPPPHRDGVMLCSLSLNRHRQRQEDPRTEAATWEELLLQRKIPNKLGGKVLGNTANMRRSTLL